MVSFTKTWHNDTYSAISPTLPELSVAGKNIVITGGGTGIGKAAAIAFAQAGAKSVAILGRRIDRLETAGKAITEANSSTQVILQTGDITDRASIEAALHAIVDKTNHKIDVFVNNAGILALEAPMVGYPEDQLRKSFEGNFLGPFNALQAFTPLAAPGAKVIHTGTCISCVAPFPEAEAAGVWSYGAMKSASQKMMEFYADENPEIHVVSFHPGIVGTEINPRIPVGPDTGKKRAPPL